MVPEIFGGWAFIVVGVATLGLAWWKSAHAKDVRGTWSLWLIGVGMGGAGSYETL